MGGKRAVAAYHAEAPSTHRIRSRVSILEPTVENA